MQPLQSAKFRHNIELGPNPVARLAAAPPAAGGGGGGGGGGGAAAAPAGSRWEGCQRQLDFNVPPQTTEEMLAGSYTGPSPAFVKWLDEFIPAPPRSAADIDADSLPLVLPEAAPGDSWLSRLYGLMEAADRLKILPLFDLCTMRFATLFRKSAGTPGFDAPTSFRQNKAQMRFGDPELGPDLGRSEWASAFHENVSGLTAAQAAAEVKAWAEDAKTSYAAWHKSRAESEARVPECIQCKHPFSKDKHPWGKGVTGAALTDDKGNAFTGNLTAADYLKKAPEGKSYKGAYGTLSTVLTVTAGPMAEFMLDVGTPVVAAGVPAGAVVAEVIDTNTYRVDIHRPKDNNCQFCGVKSQVCGFSREQMCALYCEEKWLADKRN